MPATEILSLNKAIAAIGMPNSPSLQWILIRLNGRNLLERLLVLGFIFAPVPLLPEMCVGFALATIAYVKLSIVLAFIGFPFCFGLVFLVWVHTFAFVWWPLFFSYYIVRGILWGVPCRCRLLIEACCLAWEWITAAGPMSSRSWQQLRQASRPMPRSSTPQAGVRSCTQLKPSSPQMASMTTQVMWAAASTASAVGVEAGWRLAGKDIGTLTGSPERRTDDEVGSDSPRPAAHPYPYWSLCQLLSLQENIKESNPVDGFL